MSRRIGGQAVEVAPLLHADISVVSSKGCVMRRSLRSLCALVSVALIASALLALTPSIANADTQFTDTTTSDFDAGVNEDVSVVNTGDGSIQHAPGSADFDGASLSSKWNFTSTTGGSGTSTTSNGRFEVNGGYVTSAEQFPLGMSMTFKATFSAPGQSIGFGTDTADQFIGFKTGTDANGNTVVGVKAPPSTTYIDSTGMIGVERTYRIDWGPVEKRFYALDVPGRSPTATLWATSYPANQGTKYSLPTFISDDDAATSPFIVNQVDVKVIDALPNDFSSLGLTWKADSTS